MQTFNLLDEAWIPCLGNDGKPRRVGIKEALTKAGRIRQIAASNPMDRVAIFRFLLALLYWCKGNPLSRTDFTSSDSFPADWFAKLDQHEESFNLLGEGRRFYQYRKNGDKPLTANYLIHEIPTGTNWWHFRHSTDKVEGLCPACCAMGLVRLPLFSTSGGRGKSPGVNFKPPLYVVPTGESLAQTLRLSWRQASNLGTPAWEKPDLQLPKSGEVPLLTGLTWLPRRVWLANPGELDGNCIACGRREGLITSSVFAGIGSTKTDGEATSRVWQDPHVIYEQSRRGDATSLHASNALRAADAAAGQWATIMAGMLRGKGALDALPLSIPDGVVGNDKIRAWVVGFSTVDNDKYLEAIECTLPFPRSSHQTEAVMELFKQWQDGNSGLARKLQPPNEKRSSRKHPEIQSSIAAIRPHVEGKVSAAVGDLLAGDDAAWEGAAHEYRPMMEKVARSLSPGFTTAAIQRRKQIANALPDMTLTAGPPKKAAKRKRGAK